MRILWLFAILGWSVAGCVPVTPADRGSVPPNPVSVATPIDPFARARRLQPGINLGNALEAPAEGEWGLVIREEWFDLMAEAGFRSVRLPVRWSAHALETAPYTIDERFSVRVEQVVEQATRRGLAVVLNMHHYEEMAGDPIAHQERFVAMWAQIAERFAAAPETLYFELLNEPNLALTAPLWNEMLATVIPVVRASNPALTLIAGPVDWNNFRRLPDLALPADETNVIVTIHYYDPFPFTHQGAEWVLLQTCGEGRKVLRKTAENHPVFRPNHIRRNRSSVTWPMVSKILETSLNSVILTEWHTAATYNPASHAAFAPVGVSSIATHERGGIPSRSHAIK